MTKIRETIEAAIASGRCISIDFTSKTGSTYRNRTIQPLYVTTWNTRTGLSAKVTAYCYSAEDERTFTLDGISAVYPSSTVPIRGTKAAAAAAKAKRAEAAEAATLASLCPPDREQPPDESYYNQPY